MLATAWVELLPHALTYICGPDSWRWAKNAIYYKSRQKQFTNLCWTAAVATVATTKTTTTILLLMCILSFIPIPDSRSLMPRHWLALTCNRQLATCNSQPATANHLHSQWSPQAVKVVASRQLPVGSVGQLSFAVLPFFVFGQHVVQLLVYSMAFALSGRVNYGRRSKLVVRHSLAMAKNVN